jgi:hypothetical protein
MRRFAIIGGTALGAVVVPALATAAPATTGVTSSLTYTQGQTPPAITATYNGTPPATAPTCLAYQRSDTGFTSGFVPSGATPPGVYATECADGSTSFTPRTMTVVPYLQVTRTPSVVVGGGTLPLQVSVKSATTISVTVTRGSKMATHSQSVPAGTTLVATPLVDTHGHRLPAGKYTLAVTAMVNSVGATTAFLVNVGKGVAGTEIALPPGRLGVTHPVVFTFSQPVAGNRADRPSIRPGVSGRWTVPTPYVAIFTPAGSGFAPGATETFTDRAAVWTATGTHTVTAMVRSLSNARAVQLLAQLGYLPLNFIPRTPVARNPAAEVAAATSPPAGTFRWRYAHTPSALVHLWTSDRGVMLRGAYMAFEVDHHLPMDGTLGPGVWRALESAAISGRGNRFGYSFVHVYRALPQHLVVWHNGRNVFSTLVNTGIPGRPTNYGIFPIYLRETVGTMSGTNPDGSTYHDGGIRWISYFSGGDALHQFSRPGYGYPQSLGCVEMTDAGAHRTFELTEYGTLVDTLS